MFGWIDCYSFINVQVKLTFFIGLFFFWEFEQDFYSKNGLTKFELSQNKIRIGPQVLKKTDFCSKTFFPS